MKAIGAFLVTLLVAACSAQADKTYEGYKVFTLVPQTQEHLNLLNHLTENSQLDFWTEPSGLNEPVTVMVPPIMASNLADLSEVSDMQMAVINENVQEQVDEEMARLASKGGKVDLEDFNRLEDIMDWIQDMKESCAEGLTCETYSIGKSIQGRDIMVLKISKPGAGRKAFWLDATIHAREWIATATILNITDHIVTKYPSDAKVRRLVDTYDWYIAPVLNPDGYLFSWQGNRYWRKNRNQENRCAGVDLNRNYDAKWMSDGSSSWACMDTYAGKSAASEPETKAVQKEAQRIGSTVLSWVSIHSYSNLWLTPYGSTSQGRCEYPSDYDDIMAVANAAADAVQNTYRTSWKRGSVCSVLYAASGSTVDYVKSKAGIKYSFTPELRGRDFVIRPDQIDPSFREIWNGVVAMVEKIEEVEGLRN